MEKTIKAVFKKPSRPFHPCISVEAHGKRGRIHLPVAIKCNIICRYCARHTPSCRNHLPGTSAITMTPREALSHFEKEREKYGKDAIAGISGPGEPLFNKETFETFELIRKRFPSSSFCLCTNGFLLDKYVDVLWHLGLRTISMTINGVLGDIVKDLQPGVAMGNITLMGTAAANRLIEAQLKGLGTAVKKGFFVKVNTVLAKDINEDHLIDLARTIKAAGAGIMNIVPVIPPSTASKVQPPPSDRIHQLQNECERYMPQFRLCQKCRSDASGIPGKNVMRGCG